MPSVQVSPFVSLETCVSLRWQWWLRMAPCFIQLILGNELLLLQFRYMPLLFGGQVHASFEQTNLFVQTAMSFREFLHALLRNRPVHVKHLLVARFSPVLVRLRHHPEGGRGTGSD